MEVKNDHDRRKKKPEEIRASTGLQQDSNQESGIRPAQDPEISDTVIK